MKKAVEQIPKKLVGEGKKINRLHREAIERGLVEYEEAKQLTLKYVSDEFEKYRPHFDGASGMVVNFKLMLINSRGIIHNIHPRHFKEYKEWRIAVLERDEYTCVMCGQEGGRLEVDHILQYALYPDERLNIDNGRTLCHACHKKVPRKQRPKT